MAHPPIALHGTCVRWHERGVLLEGPSGAGKSDLALRLVDNGALLVADDVIMVERRADRLLARPAGLLGHLEVRGQGIYVVPFVSETALDLAVRLVERPGARLPEELKRCLLDLEVPMVELDPWRASAMARLRLALCARRVA
jgi:HPr kinase/phosphorylase